MSTKPVSKILTSGKLTMSTRPKPHYRDKPCSKLILYMTPADLHVVMKAIDSVLPDDLRGVEQSGTPNGRAIAGICLQWLAKRVVDKALAKGLAK